MGYYTDYTISVESDHQENDLLDLLDALHGYTDYKFNISRDSKKIISGSIKWYEWREHMTQVSNDYPELLIVVYGEGEESGDIWKAYFKGGRAITLKPRIVFPEFTEDMLE